MPSNSTRPSRQRTRPAKAASQPVVSLSDKAYDLVEEMIVSLELKPGQVLSENLLSQRLHIGRTPLREALKRLEQEKLVYSVPRRGLVVSDIRFADYLCLLETRRSMDRLIATCAARRATESQRSELKRLVALMVEAARAHDVRQFIHIDHECDQILHQACSNSYAAEINATLLTHSRRFWFRYQHDDDLARSAALHSDLMTAIAGADEAKAALASDALMDYVEEFARKAMDHR